MEGLDLELDSKMGVHLGGSKGLCKRDGVTLCGYA